MRDILTEEDFIAKVDSEGGFFEAIMGYGLSYQDVEDGPIRTLLRDYEGYLLAAKGVEVEYYDYVDSLEEV